MELPNDFALGCFRALDLFQDGGALGFPAIGISPATTPTCLASECRSPVKQTRRPGRLSLPLQKFAPGTRYHPLVPDYIVFFRAV